MSINRLKRLNQSGVYHVTMPLLAFIVLFGIAGSYFLLRSEAAAWSGSLEVGGPTSGFCMDTNYGVLTDGIKVVINPCNNGLDQKWQLTGIGTYHQHPMFLIETYDEGKNLCVNNLKGSRLPFTSLYLSGCRSSAAGERFTWSWFNNQPRELYAVQTGHCIGDYRGSKTANNKVDLNTCESSGNWGQKWYETTNTASSPANTTNTNNTGSGGNTAGSGAGMYFGMAPLGTALPRSDAYCAANVQPFPERIPVNNFANLTTPSAGTNFDWGPWTKGAPGLTANFSHVDGNFSGTTDEILEWAACKWGWDQNYAKAEAVSESSWVQSTVGDSGESFGILQVKAAKSLPATNNDGWGGYPWTQRSTALDADAQMAYLRACYEGDLTYFGSSYTSGDAWDCIGSWYSGAWGGSASAGYVSGVLNHLNTSDWLNLH